MTHAGQPPPLNCLKNGPNASPNKQGKCKVPECPYDYFTGGNCMWKELADKQQQQLPRYVAPEVQAYADALPFSPAALGQPLLAQLVPLPELW